MEYKSNFSGRLSDETETHLFRISQEALTNVARHSGATHVTVELNARLGPPALGTPANEERIRLTISDNGHGLSADNGRSAAASFLENPDPERQGMGMIGMRARARNAGGELALRSEPGQGLSIDIDLPVKNREDGKKDPHLVSR